MRQSQRKSLVTVVSTESSNFHLAPVRSGGRGVSIQQHQLLGQRREREWSCDSGQRREDHLLSDAIFFVARDMQELEVLYLAWINSCGGQLAIEQIKPWGYLCLPYEQLKPSSKDDFLMQCGLSRDAGHRGSRDARRHRLCGAYLLTPRVVTKQYLNGLFGSFDYFGPNKQTEFLQSVKQTISCVCLLV